jgi:hypothetical protein
VTVTTYLASNGQAKVAQAQAELDLHVTFSANGLCGVCRMEGPCPSRIAAERTMASYGLLPRRSPGATRPELIGLRHTGQSMFQPQRHEHGLDPDVLLID